MAQAKKITSDNPQVVLIGRVNVGKSTLYNKLAEKYEAMVSDIAGTTRDIKHTAIFWQGCSFDLYDTGGLIGHHLSKKYKTKKSADIDEKIIAKAVNAVRQADLILYLVNAQDGILKEDKEIAQWLKTLRQAQGKRKKILLVANKADGVKLRQASAEFFQLGFGEPIPTSAASGAGGGDLLDKIINQLNLKPIAEEKPRSSPVIKVSIIGRPNVGKSSMLNMLLGEDRVIVSEKPHTTREPIDTLISYKNQDLILIDTAGIRRKAKISFKSLEKQGVNLSLKTIERSDVVLLIVDPLQRVGQQDLKLAQLITNARTSVIIVSNKVDLLEDTDLDLQKLPAALQHTFNVIDWAPIILTSALTGKNTHKIFDLIISVYKNYSRIVLQPDLDVVRKKLVSKQTPPRKKPLGRKGTRSYKVKSPPRLVNLKQVSTQPPHFEIVYRGVGILPTNYLKYFERGLRQAFDFAGTPIIINQNKV